MKSDEGIGDQSNVAGVCLTGTKRGRRISWWDYTLWLPIWPCLAKRLASRRRHLVVDWAHEWMRLVRAVRFAGAEADPAKGVGEDPRACISTTAMGSEELEASLVLGWVVST